MRTSLRFLRDNKILTAGLLILIASAVILFLALLPLIREEIKYIFRDRELEEYSVKSKREDDDETKTLYPVDPEFSIIIPKLNANSRIIKGVDPFNSAEYQEKLTQGVAHAKGSSLPSNLRGNTFLFAHSSQDFFIASQYNSVFYLINKLESGDKIYIVYNETVYEYEVTESKIVNPNEVAYITNESNEKILTLMTCWPAGTDAQRLLVFAKAI